MVGEALQAQNIIPAPLITLQVKSATQYQVQLMYQHDSTIPDIYCITLTIVMGLMLLVYWRASRLKKKKVELE
ncbi:spermidine/putrescine ABC transporter membrane protein [Shigella sonnei]|nr:spermidine/putrescine ABC transporter membrane protein [Shigella sonnei]